MIKLGIISIATNIYLEYWKTQAKSINELISDNFDVTLHIFTDKPAAAIKLAESLPRVSIVAHQIPAYRWPEATLYRYKLISEASESFTEEILMYLDADMILRQSISMLDFSDGSRVGVTLVKHPGFYRPMGIPRLKLYIEEPKLLLSDLYTKYRMGALGSWETNPQSGAYVERRKRSAYFCGGTWWGTRNAFLGLNQELAARVAKDEQNGVIARWHDESHLNWWAANHEHAVKPPSYCYSLSYKWLKKLPMIIQAVDKAEATRS